MFDSQPATAAVASSGSIALVVDSTCDLPAALIQRYHIKIVPLYVLFGTQSYRDGIDIDSETFYERLQHDKVHPATSQPSPEDFSCAFQEVYAAQRPSTIICLTLSSNLSGTFNSAQKAADTFTTCPVIPIDSKTASMGLGMIVLTAAEAIERGAGLDEVLAGIQHTSAQSDLFFTVNTLDYLHRGGRIGGAQRLIGMALNIRPMLGLRNGQVVAVENVRTRRRALARLVELARCMSEAPGTLQIAVVSASGKDETDQLAEDVTRSLAPVRLIRASFSPVIGVHTGPGTIGVVVFAIAEPAMSVGVRMPSMSGVAVR